MLSKQIIRQVRPAWASLRMFSSSQPLKNYEPVENIEKYSKHRMKLPIYDLKPRTSNNWIAPSATVIGEVMIHQYATIWYNAVIRGDINKINILQFVSVGENSVLLTAPSLPTGMLAQLTVGANTQIGANCSLYSCFIGEDVVIGDGCVVLEGARIENGAQLLPGTVVPPGRMIPAKQMWGGNPCQFVKDLDVGEAWSNYSKSYVVHNLGDSHKQEFDLWSSAYLDRESYQEDLEPNDFDMDEKQVGNLWEGAVKYYA